eukprot:GHVR01156090.1.p2 GENE.GHVR01156090.1~~GHVR01156090.1.p2  ORF type:complete len:101 (+),score=48.16 GHVR01156090.1:167-469(+)
MCVCVCLCVCVLIQKVRNISHLDAMFAPTSVKESHPDTHTDTHTDTHIHTHVEDSECIDEGSVTAGHHVTATTGQYTVGRQGGVTPAWRKKMKMNKDSNT